MYWWYLLIGVGVILVLTILILVWMIVTSNKLVVLKNAVDRNFPQMNSKIKEYCLAVEELVAYSAKKLKSQSKSSEHLLVLCHKCLDTEGMINRVLLQRQLAEGTKKYVEGLKKKPEFKSSKKIEQIVKTLNEIEIALSEIIKRYNECVEKYNKKRNSFPSNLVSTRFKFGERKLWEI